MVKKQLTSISHFFSKSIVKKIKRKKTKDENKDSKGHCISFDNKQAINIDEELNQDEYHSHNFPNLVHRLSLNDSLKDARIYSKSHSTFQIDIYSDDEVKKNPTANIKPKKPVKIKKDKSKKNSKVLET